MPGKKHVRGVGGEEQRMYEHVKESYQERGVSTDEAKERAARTVLKHHKDEGHKKGR